MVLTLRRFWCLLVANKLTALPTIFMKMSGTNQQNRSCRRSSDVISSEVQYLARIQSCTLVSSAKTGRDIRAWGQLATITSHCIVWCLVCSLFGLLSLISESSTLPGPFFSFLYRCSSPRSCWRLSPPSFITFSDIFQQTRVIFYYERKYDDSIRSDEHIARNCYSASVAENITAHNMSRPHSQAWSRLLCYLTIWDSIKSQYRKRRALVAIQPTDGADLSALVDLWIDKMPPNHVPAKEGHGPPHPVTFSGLFFFFLLDIYYSIKQQPQQKQIRHGTKQHTWRHDNYNLEHECLDDLLILRRTRP